MPSINKHILIGHLGQNPELRTTPTGKNVCTFSVATSDPWKDQQGNWQDDTTWHDIVVWGDLAVRVESNLQKGDLAYIEGKIKKRSYEDKSGQKRYVTETLAREVKWFKKKKPQQEQQLSPQQTLPSAAFDDNIPFMRITDEYTL